MRKFFAVIIIGFFIPISINAVSIPVPFIVQAPYGNWQQPFQDACEEATILMLGAYFDGDTQGQVEAAEARKKILDLVDLEDTEFGFNRDTDINKMARIINRHFSFNAHVVDNPTLAQIKNEVDSQHPMIVPVWGRDLISNPYFTPPGPKYHTIVISGYDDEQQQFITKEPGTRRGNDLRYGYQEIMNALADYVHGKDGLPAPNGKKRALFTSKVDLIKTAKNPKVYAIRDGKRRHIINEKVFLNSGFKWEDIQVISDQQLNNYPMGVDLVESLW